MTNASYQLMSNDVILGHFPARQLFVHDQIDDADLLLHARIRSGDYFETVATELERIAESLESRQAPELPELERIITELVKANKSYRVTLRPGVD